MYDLTYDELHKNIVQVRKKHFLDDLAYPSFIRERMIVTGTRINTGSIVVTNLAFTSALKSNTKYLMAKNKQLEKNLQAFRKEVE